MLQYEYKMNTITYLIVIFCVLLSIYYMSIYGKGGRIMNKKGEKSGFGTIVMAIVVAVLILMFV